MRRPKRYNVSIFLNCPFDDGYRPLLHAALFAIRDATLSDLAGQDAKYHGGNAGELIKAIRSFLAAKAKDVLPPQASIRGHTDIVERFERFKAEVEALASQRRLRLEEIDSFDCVPDWLALAVRWQAATV